ncbi:hypothetical protein [Paenibacillus thermotolerans]|uniref:hypothetical protein n=1 Tax=Paenibacillus thermotolerans TaxID=3027807 RepID=UPI0023686C6F|nr:MULTISPECIES: hypothetical protein [unclassified Paenibacillus]
MSRWPERLTLFFERPVPIFSHLAAAPKGQVPFVCRGYGFHPELESGLLWIYILKSQWLRLKERQGERMELAALLTSGADNESYQFKGPFKEIRLLNKEDAIALEERQKWVKTHTPNLAPLIQTASSECIAVGIEISAVFVQTPGPDAGSQMTGRSCE